MHTFSDVSLLITHYNRSESLINLLQSFKKLNCYFGEIIVSDDGSKPEHLNKLTTLIETYGFKLITTAQNKGLGNNINKGQDAVTKKFTLYVQEDFEPSHLFPIKFEQALAYMNADSSLDIVKFYAYYPYPYLRNFSVDYDEMYVKPYGLRYDKIYFYTDHPHLRRSTFFDKFGRYPEGLKGDVTEYKMCISFIQQKGKGLFYKDYANLFLQKNSEAEPSTMTRSNWKQKQNFMMNFIRDSYRQIKYNYDIMLMKSLKK